MQQHLWKVLWLWVPLALMAVQIYIEITIPAYISKIIHSETGPHEKLQFLLAVGGFIYALFCLPLALKKCDALLTTWVSCFVVGCLYIAGEEISWGQHIFNWSTPEFWGNVNDQGETNLHNASSWLDQKPRLILLIGVVTGGIIIPTLQKFKPHMLPKKFNIIYPPGQLMLIAGIALGVKIIDKLDKNMDDIIFFRRASEVEELYLFYFVLLYLLILKKRLMNT